MLNVEQAIAAILDGAVCMPSEDVALTALLGRITAADVIARMTQPPFTASAMDGYAVRFADMRDGAALCVIGEAPAGAPFAGVVGAGEAVRIYTGGVIPEGADHVVMQEDVTREGDRATITAPQEAPRHIRAAGIDFHEGDVLARAGERLHELHGAVIAASNIASVRVCGRPKVAVFSNGDELMEPGAVLKPGQIINSNHYAICEMVRRWGGDARYFGCAADDQASIEEIFRQAGDADIIVPVGGASVGDYDFVKSAFAGIGGVLNFEKVAVRPGKPTWFGMLGAQRVIGLPGNPASAIVTAALFLQPLVRRLAGDNDDARVLSARLNAPVAANGGREAYMRARAQASGDGYEVTPAGNQDSSLLRPFLEANVLIRRIVNAPALKRGERVECVWLR